MLAFPSGAGAIADPQQYVGGAGSDWFDGSAIQQPGENCSIIGEPYTEIMINGYGSYGGVDGVVHVGDEYWASVLIGIPGNPCGSGSSSVGTDLKMPKNTAFDPSRPIRCFGDPSGGPSDFGELTGGNWNFNGQSGPYCPIAPHSPFSGIGQGFGFRPLASGSFFWLFVPVKSTGVINGAGEPGETGEFNWLTTASAAYANPYRSYTWANVFPTSTGSGPKVYFARSPSAIPFWNASTPGTENRVEFFANLFSDGTGTGTANSYLGYEIRRDSDNALIAQDNCPAPSMVGCDPGFDGTVPVSPDLVQVIPGSPGPNGGYVPFAFNGLENQAMTITWDYCYSSCTAHVFGSQKFKTLAGPDLDGDGVADSADACPGVQGTLSNGCLPKPDLEGSTGVKKGAKIKRRGQNIEIDCNILSNAAAKLTIKRGLARNLGMISAAGVRIGGGKAACKPAALNKLKLKLTPKAKRKLARRGKEKASLIVVFTRTGQASDKVKVPVKITG